MTPADVKGMKVGELREALEARGLPTKGLKAALAKRLNAALAEDAAPVVEEAPAPAEAEADAEAAPEEPTADAAAPAAAEDAPAPATQPAHTTTPNPTSTEPAAGNKGRKKKKRKKKKRYNEPVKLGEPRDSAPAAQAVDDPKNDIRIEYVAEAAFAVDTTDPTMAEFSSILERFKVEENNLEKEKENEVAEEPTGTEVLKNDDWGHSDNEDEDDVDDSKLSKTQYKKLHRLSVAELKQLVERPDVIEVHDVTAADPKLLVLLKATRNTVPVPKHWSQKRKYLQNKRGIEKPPFELPKFIVDTGITEMREALQEKEDRMGLRGKLREKTRPKMGKIDIDYQKLHDAFFRFQTKPKHMSGHGDLYYEGKEYETKVTNKKPGELSDELRNALGMPSAEESLANPIPPPWLINSQRYGPPPSYPNLKIPGLNAPLPKGANWGYRGGSDGWGKVPVDEFGKPLYGDVFTESNAEFEALQTEAQPASTELWGQLESEESEEESSEEEDSDAGSGDEAESQTGTITPSGYTSETPSGVTSVDTGIETPDAIELRKRRIESDMDDNGETQTLYKVIAQKDAGSAVAQGLMGSAHVYDVAGATGGGAKVSAKKGPIGSGIEVAMDDPEALANMDQDALKAKYDAAEEEKSKGKDDFSDMVADHRAKTAKKRKAGGKKEDKAGKKFKF